MTGHIGRREFITLLGGAAAWPLAARAQHSERMRRIGVLMGLAASDPEAQSRVAAFENGLRELGWVKGRNLSIEYRWAGDGDGLRGHVAELLAMEPDLILANTTPVTVGLHKQSRTVPIVFTQVSDPIGQALVSNLAHPGRNVTGLSAFVNEMTSKRIGLMKELVPAMSRIALFANMSNAVSPPQWEETKTAARSLGSEAELLDVRSRDDVGRAFETAVERHVDALLVAFDGLFQANTRMIVELAARNRLPAIYVGREFIEAGGLMTYGVSFPHLYFRAATYVDKIFRGAQPADLPVEQPTKFELVINLKAAKAIGLAVPLNLQQLADEVIE
jgi:putative tryptophan/tyrosine transport system substrate-binding protein